MSLLERLAARWRRRWWAGMILAAAATGLLVGLAFGAAIGTAAGIVALAVPAAIGRRRLVDALVVARHLNRVVPALEESADLLCVPAADLGPLARLQRARVERSLAQLVALPTLPHRAFRLAVSYAGIAILIGAGWLIGAPPGGTFIGLPSSGTAPSGGPAPEGPPRVRGVEVTIRPPAYTRRPVRRTGDWDLDVEQGAEVTWRVRLDRDDATAGLVTTDDDTIPLAGDGDRYAATRTPAHSLLYQLSLRRGITTMTSDFHRLAVIPDAPPTLTVVRPEPRTELAAGGPRSVALEVLAGDDYGVADAQIVATVTTGAGEGVKFREQVLPFDATAPRPNGLILRKTLDLAALGMQPGDELYFHVLAHDNRAPRPNETRSETYFIALADTAAAVVADLTGLAVNRIPEYFRSQRQIIIDTEKLLAERAQISEQEFKDRSNNIGFDQHLLRERYAEISGEENVAEGTDPTLEHEHDTEENATLLARSVKATLQASLAQMWDAELRLRTYDPQAALPFEYRALELLKEVQQAARAYVLRVGFEPPPLEPDRKRLTGTLSAIGNPTRAHDVAPAPVLPNVRAALDVVRRLRGGAASRSADILTLEQAGREIAPLAIDAPGLHLATLRDLRTLIAALQPGGEGRPCPDCLVRVERGLWRALPAPDPSTRGGAAGGGGSGVGRAYFDLLREGGNP